MIWKVVEEGVVHLNGFKPEWLPHQAFKYLTLQMGLTSGQVDIQMGPYVGTIPLENGDTLCISPKMGERAFSRMVLVAEQLEEAVSEEFQRLAALGYREDDGVPWLALLCRSFISSLQEIDEKGCLTWRERTATRLDHARGRVFPLRTLLSQARKEHNPVHCSFARRSASNPENRLLGMAASKVLMTGQLSTFGRTIAARWARIGHMQQDVLADLETVISRLHRNYYAGPKAYYSAALLKARLLLADAGLALGTERTVESEALLLNARTLFEKYVRTTLQRALLTKGYTVRKGSSPLLSLFTDGVGRLEPDIVVSDKGGFRLIADVKYKPSRNVDISDYYQVVEYARAYGVPVALLLMPTESAASQTTTGHQTPDGIRVLEMRLALADPEEGERWLLSRVLEQLSMKQP